VLKFFRNASEGFYGTAGAPRLYVAQIHLQQEGNDFGSPTSQIPWFSKQAIIVLREELEYFLIPPKDGKTTTDEHGIANEVLLDVKRQYGAILMEKRSILTALQQGE
jgi:hypothetical protein